MEMKKKVVMKREGFETKKKYSAESEQWRLHVLVYSVDM